MKEDLVVKIENVLNDAKVKQIQMLTKHMNMLKRWMKNFLNVQ